MNKIKNANNDFLAKKADVNRLLLHVCCAPCLASALYKLKGIDVTCFFFNPNIMPSSEWHKRLLAVEKLIESVNSGALGDGFGKFDLIVPAQNDSEFFECVKGVELAGERSVRCTKCIDYRLKKTAQFASENGYNYFATTLTSSPQKDAAIINKLGEMAGGDSYVPSDFKKDNGTLCSKNICENLGLYRQHYCGCGLPEKEIGREFCDILFSPFKIGKTTIPNRLILAPMAGYTDVGFRHVAAKCGAGYTTTEMVSAKSLVFGNKKSIELLHTTSAEKIKAVQLFGSDPNVFKNAVQLPELKKFNIIDINMGCPMPKIVKNGDGSALMDNIERASEIIKAIRAETKKPITVKFRKGGKAENAIEFAKMCECSGANAIIVHGRTRAQLYSGNNDFELIKEVVKSVNIPVIVSGDIKFREQAAWAIYYTGAAAVMIGRAAVGNPGIFGKQIPDKKAVSLQLKFDCKYLGEKKAVVECKKHISAYFKGQEGASHLRGEIIAAKTIDQMLLAAKNCGKNI